MEILGKVYKRKEASHWQQRGFGQGGVYGVYCQTDISAWRGYTPAGCINVALEQASCYCNFASRTASLARIADALSDGVIERTAGKTAFFNRCDE